MRFFRKKNFKQISFLFRTLFAISLIICSCSPDKKNTTVESMAYKDKSLPIDERVNDLLKRMTLEEKMAQMMAVNNDVKSLISMQSDGSFNIDKLKQALPHGIGQITRISETKGGQSQTSHRESEPLTPYEHALLSNTLQRYFIEETRLGIPAIFHEESLHGLAAAYATSFPQPIAMAGTFNPELIERVYSLMAKETRLRGGHQVLSPVLDVARDPRWGRVEETFGEDPFLIAQIGRAAVRGFQGDGSFNDDEHVAATLKHFAAHGQPEGGSNTAPANYSERILREFHFAPFRHVIDSEPVYSVMATYHEIDGVPGHANKWLLTGLLREEWGFRGFVVSDYFAIREMHDREGVNSHRVARDGKHAAELAISAGVNIELPFPDCYKYIPELIEEGSIPIEQIDRLVAEMLYLKFKLGLFDNPYISPDSARKFCASEDHRKLALEAALESVTLLKNHNNTVPVQPEKYRKIAVIGPNADRVLLGGYSGVPVFTSTLLEGIREFAGASCEIVYSKGCSLTERGSWSEDEIIFTDHETNVKLIKEAVAVAADADLIILAVGGNELTSREAWSNTHLGDRSDLDLFGDQNELIDALHAIGKPIVSCAFNGRPLAFTNLLEKSDALFECWYLGQEGGHAVAKVLFGEYNPGGKLPISFPRSAGHVPVYYNHKPSARRGYLNSDISPLFPFGFGLSYTSFSLSDIRLKKASIKNGDSFSVQFQIENTGAYTGTETVQVYIRDQQSSVTRPVKELKAFRKIRLEPGEEKDVEIVIECSALEFYDINMDFVVEPGEFLVLVGTSSADEDLTALSLLVE